MHLRWGSVALAISSLWAHFAGAEGRIEAIQVRAGEVELSVSTTEGMVYEVQCTTNLASGNWTTAFEDFTAETPQTNIVLSSALESCLFRVVEKEPPLDPDGEPPPPPPPPPVPGE